MRFPNVVTLIVLSINIAAHASERIYVVDISSSMDGGKLLVVRNDLTAFLKAQPPSQNLPVTFIMFSSGASLPRRFTSLDPALEYVSTIGSDGGGTSIASGLNRALDVMLALPPGTPCSLTLLTDDEDGSPHATALAVQKIKQLMQQQQDHDIGLTVILRSWGAAHSTGRLITALQGIPGVNATQINQPLDIESILAATTVTPCQVGATMKPTGVVRWGDITKDEVIYEVELTAALKAKTQAFVTPVELTIGEVAGTTIVSGGAPMVFSQPGTKTVMLELAVVVNRQDVLSGIACPTAEVEVSVPKVPPELSIPSPTVTPSCALAAPPPLETMVTIATQRVSPAVWEAQPAIAAVQIDLDLTVNGVLPEDARVGVNGPPGVVDMKLVPDRIETGHQVVRLLVAFVADPTTKSTALEFRFDPPAGTPLLQVSVTDTLTVDIATPRRPRLVPVGTAGTGDLTVAVLDTATHVNLSTLFVLEGPVTQRFIKETTVELTGKSLAQRCTGDLSQPVHAKLSLSQARPRPYWQDALESLDAMVNPTISGSVVQSGNVTVVARSYAPFKRHLVIGLVVVSVVATVVLFKRLTGAVAADKLALFDASTESA